MGSGDATVLFGRGAGTFADGAVFESDLWPGAIAIGDLDGDGRSDVVLPSGPPNSLTLLYGNADSIFDLDTVDLGVASNSVAGGALRRWPGSRHRGRHAGIRDAVARRERV